MDAISDEKSYMCQKVKLKTFKQARDGRTIGPTTEVKHIAVKDVCKLKKHHYVKKKHYNILRGKHNCDGFSNMKNNIKYSHDKETNCNMLDNELIQLYLTTITLLGLYITLKFIYKK